MAEGQLGTAAYNQGKLEKSEEEKYRLFYVEGGE
jgi:hypothetical protein